MLLPPAQGLQTVRLLRPGDTAARATTTHLSVASFAELNLSRR
jgi:hypothetical protein